MSEAMALVFAYGFVAMVLLVYIVRLRHRLQALGADRRGGRPVSHAESSAAR